MATNLQQFLPQSQGGGPFLPVHPILKDVKSGGFRPAPQVNWEALAKLMDAFGGGNASGGVGGGLGHPAGITPLTNSDFNNILLQDVISGKKGRAALTGTDLLKPEVLTFLDQLENERELTGAKRAPKPSAFHRVVDVLSRPAYMGVNFLGELIDPKFSKGSNPLEAAGKGLWGTEKHLTSDILKQQNILQGKGFWSGLGRGALSFTGDVLLDPTTYLFGLGAVKNVGTKAAIKGGQVAGLGADLEHAATTLGDFGKIGNQLPGPEVPGLLHKDEGFAEFLGRYSQKLRGDNPYLTRREKQQIRDVGGIRLPNAVGKEAEEAVYRKIMLDEGIQDRSIVDMLGDPMHDLATVRQDPWADFHYSNNPSMWDDLRTQTYDPEGLQGTLPGQRKFGINARKTAANELETRMAGDLMHPILDQIDALPEMKKYFARVGIPFTRLQKKFDLSKIGLERETGKFIKRMQDVKQGTVKGLPGEQLVARAWNRWDQVFQTAMKHNPSIAGVRTDFYSSLSYALKAISDNLNKTFEGLDKGQRREVMNALLDVDLSKVSHITNASGDNIGDAIMTHFDDVATRINNTIDKFGGNYEQVGSSMLANIPSKYRMTEGTWEAWVKANQLSHQGGKQLTGKHLADFIGHQYRPSTPTGRARVPSYQTKNLDPAEAMYHLTQGVQDYINRRGYVEGIRQLGITPTVGKPKQGVPNNAAVQMLQNMAPGTMREIEPRDLLTRSRRPDKYVENTVNGLKGTQFAEDIIPHIIKTLEMTSPKQSRWITEQYVNVMQKWKRLNTIWGIPRFHLRNTYSDLALNHMNGLAPNSIFRPGSGYGKAIKVMRATAPNDTIRDMMDEMYMHFKPGEYPNILSKTKEISGQVAQKAGLTPEQEAKLMKPIITIGGEKLNALDIYGLYRQHGLESHFHSEDLARLNMRKGQKGFEGVWETIKRPAKGKVADKVYLYSSMRENYFRMSNFIHSLERELKDGSDLSRAAQKTSEDVRKFNFDYSDVTSTERSVANGIMPFYKWSRKSIPLLLTSLFQNPRIFAIWNHFQDAIQTAAGEQEINKSSVLPDFYDRVPSYMIEGGGFKLGSKNGDPLVGTGLPNLWRDSLAFLTGVPYKGGAREQLNTFATATKNQGLEMLGPLYSLLGIGPAPSGMPDTKNLFSETLPGQKGNDIAKVGMSTVGGPLTLLRAMAESKAYNDTQRDYPSGMQMDPVLFRYLTGTDVTQLTAPRQMSAINNIYDMLKELQKAEGYTEGQRTPTEFRREQQSWNPASQTSTMESLMKLLGGG